LLWHNFYERDRSKLISQLLGIGHWALGIGSCGVTVVALARRRGLVDWTGNCVADDGGVAASPAIAIVALTRKSNLEISETLCSISVV
jgi:hypothetical protein